jgi:AAA ATPase domain/Protein of unknown function (DUF3696)
MVQNRVTFNKNRGPLTLLSQWRIENFKSVKNAKIDLAPLTVLVGPNSAGKSSLIQSILLFAQNARRQLRAFDGTNRGQMILNGDLVNLGTLEEAHSDLAQSKDLPIRFGATFKVDVARRAGIMFRRAQSLDADGQTIPNSVPVLDWNLDLMNEPGLINSGTAAVKKIDMFYTVGGEIKEELRSEFTAGSHLPTEIPFDTPNYTEKYLTTVSLKKQKSIGVNEFEPVLFPDLRYSAINLNAGLPVDGIRLITPLERELEEQKKIFSGYGAFRFKLILKRLRMPEVGSLISKESALNLCSELMLEKLKENDDTKKMPTKPRIFRGGFYEEETPIVELHSIQWKVLEDFIAKFPEIALDARKSIFDEDKLDELKENVAEDLDHQLSRELMEFWEKVTEKVTAIAAKELTFTKKLWESSRDRARFFDPDLFSASQNWGDWLASGILYLEPLREAPKANYTYSSGGAVSPQIPIGSKGEHLAQRLYDLRLSSFPVPENLVTGEKTTLIDAVNRWLKFLNIEGPIKVEPQGRSGLQLTVGGKVLPMLGTGISQVLPVITLCLIARPGDLVLLEQPELHLNPSLQQTLADFLMVIAKSGRQIIVETHSEYLVTRLRINSLEESQAGVSKILFVEKRPVDGTTYREVKSNEYGEILEWPAGFFDQASSDYKRLILKIAQKKEKIT